LGLLLARAGAAGKSPFEKAAAPSTNSAAAQLDKNCCAIFWTRTVLAESPEFVDSAKRGLTFSKGDFPVAPSDRAFPIESRSAIDFRGAILTDFPAYTISVYFTVRFRLY